jgi:uncharacterized protein YjdB
VAAVDESGVITGINAGSTVIMAITAQGKFTATCELKVNPFEDK